MSDATSDGDERSGGDDRGGEPMRGGDTVSGRKVPDNTRRLLFVCTGNTCRSPMAEAVARVEAARRGLRGVRVRSAGTFGGGGAPASVLAAVVGAERGLDLSAHRSRRLAEEDLEWADLVLAMAPSHLAAVRAARPEARAELLTRYLPEDDPQRGAPVIDPIGGERSDYEAAMDVLERAVAGLLDALYGPPTKDAGEP